MLRHLPTIILIAALAAMAGCVSPSFAPAGSEVSFARSRPTDQGKFIVTLTPRAEPVPINQIHSWDIALTTPAGAPVTKASFYIGGGMPDHGHGFPTKPVVRETSEPGKYVLEGMKFSMHGRWEIKFAIQAGEVSDIVFFNTMVALPEAWSESELTILASLRLARLPPVPRDPSNAFETNPAAIALGRRIFFDPRFSQSAAVSCSTCHDPNRHFQDGRPLSQGMGLGSRRTPTLLGAAHSPWLFWDGRKDSLWSQALSPLESAIEHGSNRTRIARTVQRLYRHEYESIFGGMPDLSAAPGDAGPLGSALEQAAWSQLDTPMREAITRVFANVGKAIAAYEKTLALAPSRFDAYVNIVLGDHTTTSAGPTLTSQELNGLRIFIGKGRCVTCHAGPLFTDHHFHSTRVPERDPANPDQGRAAAISKLQGDEFNCMGRFSDAPPAQCDELRYLVTNDAAMLRAFKTPGLRNVATRPPYMHAGQLATLRDVISHYVKAPDAATGPDGMVHRLGLNSELQPLPLSPQEIADLVEFLGAI
jgi:cytochrome c peroxidase